MKHTFKRISNLSRGFTLIEVMASLAILAVTVIPIMTIRASDSKAIAESVNKRTVSMLLRRKLTQVLTDRTAFSGIMEDRGDLADYGYESIRWRVSISPIAVPSQDPATIPCSSKAQHSQLSAPARRLCSVGPIGPRSPPGPGGPQAPGRRPSSRSRTTAGRT